MKKKLFPLIALVSLLSATFSTAQGADPIEGRWGTVQAANGFTFDMTFAFQSNQLTLTNVCSYMGRSSTASVSVPVQYDGSVLTVLANAKNEQSGGGVNCEASVEMGRIHYVVQGNSLIFTQDNVPGQMVLNRK